MIGMDLIGPLEKSINGFSYIFHVVDSFSRYTKAWPYKTDKPEDVINHLSKLFEQYSILLVIYSDRGTHFKAKQTKDFLD